MLSKKRLIYSIILLLVVISGSLIINKMYNNKEEIVRDYPEIKQNRILNIVTNYNSPNYYVSGDSITGFTHDILKTLTYNINLKINIIVENNLEKSINGLENGDYDIIARNIPVNNSLKDKIVFTEPILQNKLVLVQRIDENHKLIRNHLNLAKKTIYTPHLSPASLRLQNLSHEIGDTIYIKEDDLYDTSQLIMKVASGEIKYTVSDIKTAQKLKKLFPQIDIETDIGFTHFEAWAIRKNSPILLDSINNWIIKYRTTKEFAEIYNKYYR